MSDREKKLLTFFAIAGFAILNFLGFNYAQAKRVSVNQQRNQALQQLEVAEMAAEKRDEVVDEMDWLAEHEPEPQANQDVQTTLQKLVDSAARSTGLEVKTQKALPTDATEGKYFHRAKFQFVVSGTEEALYRWFDKLNEPNQLRVATQIRLSPNQQDDTKIDCTATIEQWFVPVIP